MENIKGISRELFRTLEFSAKDVLSYFSDSQQTLGSVNFLLKRYKGKSGKFTQDLVWLGKDIFLINHTTFKPNTKKTDL